MLYYHMGVKAHNFFNDEKTEEIQLMPTEIPETGQMADFKYVDVDNNKVKLLEFLSKPLNIVKLMSVFDYHDFERLNLYNKGVPVESDIISTANPNHGIQKGFVYSNICFMPDIIFTKNIDGEEILNTLLDKCNNHIVLDGYDQVGLLVLPDTDIDMPSRELLELTTDILANAEIPQEDYDRMVLCHVIMLYRFFTEDEVLNMIDIIESKMSDPKVIEAIDKYGFEMGLFYLDQMAVARVEGRNEGISKGRADGIADDKKEIAGNLIAMGCDDEFISQGTGLSIKKVAEIRKKL